MNEIYKREIYLEKIRNFYSDTMIKVITGIRRAGKSSIIKTIKQELIESGVKAENVIFIELDRKENINIDTPQKLELLIDSYIKDKEFKYLFIDEVQNVVGYEKLINAYKEEGNFSIFITGSNSYLLSGELATKLSGRYIEFEILPLNFYEYTDMKKSKNLNVDENIYIEFENYIRDGGLPGSLSYQNYNDKLLYTKSVINQIFEKDIKTHQKIKDRDLFESIQKFIINNFGSIISIASIQNYLIANNIKTDRRTIKKYISVLENAKIIYACEMFDIKSKTVLTNAKKYYLADLSIYFSLNTDNRINYGPVLENILFSYLKSLGYDLSVGKIGKLECDFIARMGIDEYFYLQVSKNIENEETANREYKPFYQIKEMYPRYLFLLDFIFQKNVDGVNNVNIVDFIYNNKRL